MTSVIKKKKKRPKSSADNFTNAKIMRASNMLTQEIEPTLFKFLHTDSSPIRNTKNITSKFVSPTDILNNIVPPTP